VGRAAMTSGQREELRAASSIRRLLTLYRGTRAMRMCMDELFDRKRIEKTFINERACQTNSNSIPRFAL